MNEAPSGPSPSLMSEPGLVAQDPAFDALERPLGRRGPREAIEQLIDHMEEAGDYRLLLNALLLRARHELGLPLIQVGGLSSLAEPVRTQFEERYVEAIRRVGSKFLAAGEIPTAWAYFRAIAEPEPVRAVLEVYRPDDDAERLGHVIDVAFNQGANPRRGFELILDHYGICSAITALEQVPPGDLAIQIACIERLIGRLHAQLVSSLRADLAQRGHPAPAEAASIAELIAGRDWLFADEAYHNDISHLSTTVRYSILVSDPATLALAVDLTEYGRRLASRLQYEGMPPFERTFDDHRVFLRALLGLDVDAAIGHFRNKVEAVAGDDLESSMPAQVLVNLLVRVGRIDEAIDLAAERLAHLPEQALTCPSLAQLCQQRGRMDRLAEVARQRGDMVHFLAARLQDKTVEKPQSLF
jgi:hypothetical protein